MSNDTGKTLLDAIQDERVMKLFENILRRAREKAVAAQAAESAVFKALEDMCIDPDSEPTDAENASTLAEAITCFLGYGEYSIAGIVREVRKAYDMVKEKQEQ